VNVVELQRSSQIELKIRLNRFDSNKFELWIRLLSSLHSYSLIVWLFDCFWLDLSL
jgi:hypothetical protein